MIQSHQDALNILVADDSSTIRRFIVRAIGNSGVGATCTEAADGSECLKRLASRKFDIAFIDVNMPALNGIDAVARSRNVGIDTFAVIMSTQWSARRIELARSLKVYEYLTKPFGESETIAILENYRRFRRPTSVLLVDDSAATRSVIKRVFDDSIFNLHVDEAADGPAALVAYKVRRHDIVFLDVNMPDIDGLDTLKMLRKLNENVRLVLITGDRRRNLADSLAGGAAPSLLYKPFFKADVDRVLHELFDLRVPTFGEDAAPSADVEYI